MAKKWNCPTCNTPNIPKGMHCRACLCDILSGTPIGTTERFMREKRRRKQGAKQENDFMGIADAVWYE